MTQRPPGAAVFARLCPSEHDGRTDTPDGGRPCNWGGIVLCI